MQQLYHIRVNCYNWDSWDIYTEDKILFSRLRACHDTDDAKQELGNELWEQVSDSYVDVKYPVTILDYAELRQYD